MDADSVFQFSVTPKQGDVESRNLKKLLILIGVLCFVIALTVEMMHSYVFLGIQPIGLYVHPAWVLTAVDALYAIACLALIVWTWVAYDKVRNWEPAWLDRHLARVGLTWYPVNGNETATLMVVGIEKSQLSTADGDPDNPMIRYPRPTSTKLRGMGGTYPILPGSALVLKSRKTREAVAEDIRAYCA